MDFTVAGAGLAFQKADRCISPNGCNKFYTHLRTVHEYYILTLVNTLFVAIVR